MSAAVLGLGQAACLVVAFVFDPWLAALGLVCWYIIDREWTEND